MHDHNAIGNTGRGGTHGFRAPKRQSAPPGKRLLHLPESADCARHLFPHYRNQSACDNEQYCRHDQGGPRRQAHQQQDDQGHDHSLRHYSYRGQQNTIGDPVNFGTYDSQHVGARGTPMASRVDESLCQGATKGGLDAEGKFRLLVIIDFQEQVLGEKKASSNAPNAIGRSSARATPSHPESFCIEG